MSEKINLSQIFDDNFDCYSQIIKNWKRFEDPAISKDKFKEVCLEFGKQLLALAFENAEIVIWQNNDDLEIVGNRAKYLLEQTNLKQSITDTIKLVE